MRIVQSKTKRLLAVCVACCIACCLAQVVTLTLPEAAFASSASVNVSSEGDAAAKDDVSFGLMNFSRAMVGSNREIDDAYLGYAYYTGDTPDRMVAVFAGDNAVVYIPESMAQRVEFSYTNSTHLDNLAALLQGLDEANAKGGSVIDPDALEWHVTSDSSYVLDGVVYSFGVCDEKGRVYATVQGEDGSDITDESNPLFASLDHADIADIAPRDEIPIALPATGWEAMQEFLAELDWSPLWVTLKTTGTAIVIVFVLGLLAAYWLLRLPSRVQDVLDAVFTIPMVLPPTVCGFLLLLALGRNTGVGRWFIDVGFPLIFSWQATVIAAVVVSFPLMYRSARGAFESLDANMLDAARTLGWNNRKIFFRLMLPLSWSSIAAGTVLAFARALGEFGATLFLAGNYAGITQTIPIAIYFQWMNGNTDVALFWTGVVMIFSFLVIMFVNMWSKRTTRYRRKESDGA